MSKEYETAGVQTTIVNIFMPNVGLKTTYQHSIYSRLKQAAIVQRNIMPLPHLTASLPNLTLYSTLDNYASESLQRLQVSSVNSGSVDSGLQTLSSPFAPSLKKGKSSSRVRKWLQKKFRKKQQKPDQHAAFEHKLSATKADLIKTKSTAEPEMQRFQQALKTCAEQESVIPIPLSRGSILASEKIVQCNTLIIGNSGFYWL